jgi:hypothetical protein
MIKRIGVLALFQLLVLGCAANAQTAPAGSDWKAVEQALGWPGQLQGDGAYNVVKLAKGLRAALDQTK